MRSVFPASRSITCFGRTDHTAESLVRWPPGAAPRPAGLGETCRDRLVQVSPTDKGETYPACVALAAYFSPSGRQQHRRRMTETLHRAAPMPADCTPRAVPRWVIADQDHRPSERAQQPMLAPELGLQPRLQPAASTTMNCARRTGKRSATASFSDGDTEVVLRAHAEWGTACATAFMACSALAIHERDSGG